MFKKLLFAGGSVLVILGVGSRVDGFERFSEIFTRRAGTQSGIDGGNWNGPQEGA